MKIVILGLSITSLRGNGHACTYRGLVRELSRRGHEVTFLERDVPWLAAMRDLPEPPYGTTKLYGSTEELRDGHRKEITQADLVVVGSYVPDGIAIGDFVTEEAHGVTAFYDLDTPVTVSAVERGECKYLSRMVLPKYDLYLSLTGGTILSTLERRFGARRARPLYCSVDPERCFPEEREQRWDLGYLGAYSTCRQSTLATLMLDAARADPSMRMVVAGSQYPADILWPANIEHIDPLFCPQEHRAFFTAQRFTLNVTRADLVSAGYCPSATLFEAAACGTPVISDAWQGMHTFFRIGSELFVARSAADTLRLLTELKEKDLRAVGERARRRVLAQHTVAHRAAELEAFIWALPVRNPSVRSGPEPRRQSFV